MDKDKVYIIEVEGEGIPAKRRRAARCIAALLVGDDLMQQEVAMLLGLEGPLGYAEQEEPEVDPVISISEATPQFVEL